MRRSFLAAIILSGVSCAFAAQETLNVDLVVNGKTHSLSLDLPATSAVLNKSTMKSVQFEPTSGNCSGVDVSEVAHQHPSGVAVRVVAVPEFEGERLFQMTVTYSEFLGTTPIKARKSCVINAVLGTRFGEESTFGLKRGVPLEVFSQKDSLNPAKNISVRAEWR